ncbi:hypothetical protein PLESTB_000996200 [Pleodorina starrii]|uniref:Acetolactate synthase large subunit n=1 Tax=Pleodorina starrii TaxID=330485 RepID=A0A9W6BNT2_9CHLO|nr:hypothetical protein PLESTM_001855200 [Pleodorina starrii]GLC55519.1 hypothetical protein PLESTB_000996200 [Pleodorina starrii]GLC76400.1 hypothetical protein PLESTF_001776400 [Pleodorina starrii]
MAQAPDSHRLNLSDDPDDMQPLAATTRASSSSAAPAPLAAAAAGPAAAAVAATAAPTPTTGAEALLLTAVRYGADVCFANPGTTEMWMVAAMDRLWPAVRPVLCLHENVATGAADGYARIARRPALTLLHLGPGLANGLANLHNARRARTPVVNLVGDMATWHRANDPPLNSPLEALAATVSGSVVVAGTRQQPPRPGASPSGDVAVADGAGSADSDMGPAGRLGAALAAALGSGPSREFVAAADPSGPAAAEGAAAAAMAAGGPEVRPVGGSVVTVIVPHDLSWEPPPPSPPLVASLSLSSPSTSSAAGGGRPAAVPSAVTPGLTEPNSEAAAAAEAFVRDCAAALLRAKSRRDGGAGGSGGAALYLGGEALLAADGALLAAGQIAAATGAVLLCEGAFARADRGAGLPALRRLPYFPQEAAAELARYGCVVLVDAKPPVANFGYKGAPGRLLAPHDDDPSAVWEFDPAALSAAGWSAATALHRLAAALGPAAAAVRPLVNCGGVFVPPRRPAVPPPGRLTAAALCAVLAALQPEGAVVVDESLTSGSSYWEASKGCPPFVHLTLTGGAIGSGPPMALGAAVALAAAEQRDGGGGGGAGGDGGGEARRRVINLQADGSAMYSLQALWSQARDQLPITTIICANSSYAILRVEAARQRLPGMGPATRVLTDLSSPRLDWVSLAAGMGVPGCKVDTVEDFARELEAALVAPGPVLIQADL